MSSMNVGRKYTDDRGATNIVLIALITVSVLLIAAASFGIWAFGQREDYRTNTQSKIKAAVEVAKQETSVVKDKEHAEADKQPLKTYSGPEQYGSIKVAFPKTWSGYVFDAARGGSQPLDAYFQPGIVPSTQSQESIYALRVQVTDRTYSTVVTQLNQQVTAKKLTASTYSLPKVPGVVGLRFEGEFTVSKKTTGVLVVLPLRDKTLQIWTENASSVNDLNTLILPNITFTP